MSITKKAQAVIGHLKVAGAGLTKPKIHLLQAQAGLRKADDKSAEAVQRAMQNLDAYEQTLQAAIGVVQAENPAPTEED